MRIALGLATVSLIAVGGCSVPFAAQGHWQVPQRSPAYEHGYERGARAGLDDWQRGQAYRFDDERDYRRADDGYRRQYGPLDPYQYEFRRGYELGYRDGYARNQRGRGYGVPPRNNDRYGPQSPRVRYEDPATQTGYSDGYEAGLDDGRDRRASDYVGERRYRSGDRGYQREYGTREAYKNRYRSAFRQGYEVGYADGRRRSE